MKIIHLVIAAFIITTSTRCNRTPQDPDAWSFCECDLVHKQIKKDLALETDTMEAKLLQAELEIVQEECGHFLLDRNSTFEERRDYFDRARSCSHK